MGVRRGSPWGVPGALAAGAPVVDTDADLVEAVTDAVSRGEMPEVGLTGGDLHRSLGSPQHCWWIGSGSAFASSLTSGWPSSIRQDAPCAHRLRFTTVM